MNRKAKIRPAARRDIKRLAAFLAEAPPEISEELIRRLEARIDWLTRFPFLGRPLRSGLRESSVRYGKSVYVLRYKVDDNQISIVRIWHARENRPLT